VGCAAFQAELFPLCHFHGHFGFTLGLLIGVALWIFSEGFHIIHTDMQHHAMQIVGLILCRLSRRASQLYVADRFLCGTPPFGRRHPDDISALFSYVVFDSYLKFAV